MPLLHDLFYLLDWLDGYCVTYELQWDFWCTLGTYLGMSTFPLPTIKQAEFSLILLVSLFFISRLGNQSIKHYHHPFRTWCELLQSLLWIGSLLDEWECISRAVLLLRAVATTKSERSGVEVKINVQNYKTFYTILVAKLYVGIETFITSSWIDLQSL